MDINQFVRSLARCLCAAIIVIIAETNGIKVAPAAYMLLLLGAALGWE